MIYPKGTIVGPKDKVNIEAINKSLRSYPNPDAEKHRGQIFGPSEGAALRQWLRWRDKILPAGRRVPQYAPAFARL